MSTQDKSKSKASEEEVEALAKTTDSAEDNYKPQVEATLRTDFDCTTYGHVVAQFIGWSDSRFTEMSVNVFRLEPKGMAMTTYVPILIGSYPVPNCKH